MTISGEVFMVYVSLPKQILGRCLNLSYNHKSSTEQGCGISQSYKYLNTQTHKNSEMHAKTAIHSFIIH
jgi:collagenase-like PrtC family protease